VKCLIEVYRNVKSEFGMAMDL